jgi:hypothetical protein
MATVVGCSSHGPAAGVTGWNGGKSPCHTIGQKEGFSLGSVAIAGHCEHLGEMQTRGLAGVG